MSPSEGRFVSRNPGARTLVVSLRHLLPRPNRACNYEFEDMVASIDRADVWGPTEAYPVNPRAQRAVRRFLPAPLQLGGKTPVDREYDLLFVCCQDPSDLYLLGPLGALQARCAKTICWIDELWAHRIPWRRGEMRLLSTFDLVVLGCQQSVAPAIAHGAGNVVYSPPGVDALRFSPWPEPVPRVIDVYNMGRRAQAQHDALLAQANAEDWFYLFDTFAAGNCSEPKAHRAQLRNLIQRSRYFVTNAAKVNAPGDTGGQEEVGFRFFEGAAGGAVLIGQRPNAPTYPELFGWEDAVIDLPTAATDVRPYLEHLESDPERVDRIRRRNVRQSLLRHDWAYRWAQLLELTGLRADPKLERRLEDLSLLAQTVWPGGMQGSAPRDGKAPKAAAREA